MSKFSYKFFAGFCMGIAEITPGISGATIAGLFNVYKDFVNFLNVFNSSIDNFVISKFIPTQ